MAFNKTKVMDAARKYVEKGQVDRAIKEYLRVVKEDPKDVRVWLKIGDLYAKKGAKAEATETYLKVARFYGEQGFYLKAVAVYKQILKLDARLVEVNLKLAELYRQLGLMSDAMQHFEMVAAHFHREGKTKEALATVRQLVDLDPENIATRIKLAELYSKEGMVEEAVAEFTHACEFLRAHNRQDDFIKVAERLLWHKPDNHALNRELATLYLRRKDPRRALQKLQVCFKADSRDVETLALLAQAFQALDQKSKTVSVLKELARVLDEAGQKAQAEDVHRKILIYVPDDPDSLAYLGETRAPQVAAGSAAQPAPAGRQRFAMTSSGLPSLRGNPTGSVPLLEDEADDPDILEPEVGGPIDTYELDDPDELDDLDDVDAAAEDFVADLSMEEEASSFDTGSVAGELHAEEIIKILTETDVYVKYGLHQKAVDHLRRVFELDPGNIEARERLKDIFVAQGRDDEALAELVKLAEAAAPADPDRAEFYLREILAIDATYQPAFELAHRFRLDVAGAPQVEIVDDESEGVELLAEDLGTGQVAPVEDDLDFDDLDFDDAEVMGSGPAIAPSLEPEPYAAATSTGEYGAGDDFDFDLDDGVDHPPEDRSGVTMEVDVDQVEEMVALSADDDEVEELDFDDALLSEPSAPVITPAPDPGLGYAAPVVPEFDPEDAAAFDADVAEVRAQTGDQDEVFTPPAEYPEPGLGIEAHELDAEPISDMSDFAMPTPAAAAGHHHDYFDDGADPYSPDQRPTRRGGMELPDFGDEAGSAEVALDMPTVDGDYEVLGDASGVTLEETDAGALAASAGVEAGGDTGGLEDDLDEADFFVSQGLYSEARDILDGLLARYPNHPLVRAKLQDVDAMEQAASGRAPSEADFGDLDVDDDPDPRASRPTVLLEKPIDEEDADTHYDLGLAYKEMGLYDEAMKSFLKVVNVPGREVQVHLMLGLCHRERGSLSESINQFKSALHVASISDREKLSLYYEIAASYESIGDAAEALYYYEMVAKKDPEYREVGDRLAHLRAGNGSSGRRAKAPEDTDAAIDSLLAESGDQ